MALDTKISIIAANAEANAVGALLNHGSLLVYGGEKAAGADVTTAEAPLAELKFAAVAFSAAADGVITSLIIAPDLNTNALGEPTWFRCVTADGAVVFDGTIGKAGCNINIISNSEAPLMVYPGGEFHVGSITYSALGF